MDKPASTEHERRPLLSLSLSLSLNRRLSLFIISFLPLRRNAFVLLSLFGGVK